MPRRSHFWSFLWWNVLPVSRWFSGWVEQILKRQKRLRVQEGSPVLCQRSISLQCKKREGHRSVSSGSSAPFIRLLLAGGGKCKDRQVSGRAAEIRKGQEPEELAPCLPSQGCVVTHGSCCSTSVFSSICVWTDRCMIPVCGWERESQSTRLPSVTCQKDQRTQVCMPQMGWGLRQQDWCWAFFRSRTQKTQTSTGVNQG